MNINRSSKKVTVTLYKRDLRLIRKAVQAIFVVNAEVMDGLRDNGFNLTFDELLDPVKNGKFVRDLQQLPLVLDATNANS